MSDITMCPNRNCPLNKTCYRYTAKQNPTRQSWGRFIFTTTTDNKTICTNYKEVQTSKKLSALERNHLKQILVIAGHIKRLYENGSTNIDDNMLEMFFDEINPTGDLEDIMESLDLVNEHFLGKSQDGG